MFLYSWHRILQVPVYSFVTVLGMAACDREPTFVQPSELPPLVRFVSGAAAAALSENGEFALNGPIEFSYAQISGDIAATLADAYRKDGLVAHASYIEQTRGGGVDFSALRKCGRIYYAEPALEPLPSEVAPAVRRAYGPHWVVSFCSRSGPPQVVIAVSALATELNLRDGRLVYPFHDGGSFFRVTGVPKAGGKAWLGTPETAASVVAMQTGRRVTAVPRLVTPAGKAPEASFWVIEVDRPVQVTGRRTRAESVTSEFYYTDDPRWGHTKWIQTPGGRATFQYQWAVPSNERGRPANFRTGYASPRPGHFIDIEPMAESRE